MRTAHLAVPIAFAFTIAHSLPAQSALQTRWAAGVTAENAHRDYPRMQMRRDRWLCLNGTWQFAIRAREAGVPTQWDGDIVVPFPVESKLSGVARRVGPGERLWYRRTFTVAEKQWLGGPLWLHFGAVDWHAEVWVDGARVGEHTGGYDPFAFDIAAVLQAPREGEHEIVVGVFDPSDLGTQPRGKQTSRPGGIWYTPTTGIWQTVWLEPLFGVCWLRSVRADGDPHTGAIAVHAEIAGHRPELRLRAIAALDGREVASALGEPGSSSVRLAVPEPKAWTPDSPTLYDLRVELWSGDPKPDAPGMLDRVDSYVGLRTIAVDTAADGHRRLFLNGAPLFQYGMLDQGFWPDGLYTAPSDEAMRADLEAAKRLGFNMLRKHVKVEPDRFYWWCDKLGILIWQDMPSGDGFIGPGDADLQRSAPSGFQFERELRAMVDALRGHPSIVMWVPFNEGWGQYDTGRIAAWLRSYDPTRLVDATSGWADRGAGDVNDVHVYPGPGAPAPEPARAAVLGEFGGLGLPLAGHTWQAEKNWGYRSYESREALTAAYVQLVDRMRWLQAEGLAAAVYTQLTDVEIEVNGLLTYDREVIKPDADAVRAANLRLHAPPPRLTTVLATSQAAPQRWRFTTAAPADGWFAAAFDDAAWREAPGGFGTAGTPGAVVGTVWDGPDIWCRRTFDVAGELPRGGLQLRIHHDEDAEVWLNGVLAARLGGYTDGYVLAPLDPAAAATLKAAGNVLAVHCHQTRGGQFVDVGLVAVDDGR
ncbi:MAG: glycoside hydrolase family 2 TIM barrel-domain containing protein [Planctomycetota bacterium]